MEGTDTPSLSRPSLKITPVTSPSVTLWRAFIIGRPLRRQRQPPNECHQTFWFPEASEGVIQVSGSRLQCVVLVAGSIRVRKGTKMDGLRLPFGVPEL